MPGHVGKIPAKEIQEVDLNILFCFHLILTQVCNCSKYYLFSGPLFLQPVDGQFTQIGIVSWGFGCADITPGVYTNIANLLPWIQRILAYY